MARSSSAPLLALILLVSFAAEAQTTTKRRPSQAAPPQVTKPGGPITQPRNRPRVVRPRPRPGAQSTMRPAGVGTPKIISSPRWTAGYGLWTEKLKMTRSLDGREYELLASMRTLSVGYQMDWMRRNYGWLIEGQALFGDTTTASQDQSLTYTHSGASLMGLSGTALYHWNFERPRLFIGLGLGSMWRQVQFQNPSGYTVGNSSAFINHAKLDFSFPIAPRFEVYQQFGIPLDKNGHFWQIGLRRY